MARNRWRNSLRRKGGSAIGKNGAIVDARAFSLAAAVARVPKTLAALILLLGLSLAACAAEDATPVPGVVQTEEKSRLERVRERGKLVCASGSDTPGFGYIDADGNSIGFDVDLCRAVAAAVLGDPDALEIRIVTSAERGPVLQAGETDVLSTTTTWTSSRDAQWGNFTQTMFYDGQGFMVPRSLGVDGALQLRDANVCVSQGTTTELNLQDFSNEAGLNMNVITFEKTDAVLEAYRNGQCDAFTTDRSALSSLRGTFANPDDHLILPDIISEEPLGPVVPHGDEQWYDIVKTVMAILIYAEAFGVGMDNVPAARTGDSEIDRIFGLEGSFGQDSLGLSRTVAQDVIRSVGNYGEIYRRNLGAGGIGLLREGGRNALWANAPCQDCPKGGQIYSAPLR